MRTGHLAVAAAFISITVLGAAAVLKGGRSPAAAQTANPTATPAAAGGSGCTCTGNGSSGMMPGMMSSMMAGQSAAPVSSAAAAAAGKASPAGATVDAVQNRITFTTTTVSFTVLASPDDGPDMTFRVAGLADPTIVVPQGATVTVQFINADADTPHGWLLSAAPPPFSVMAMMSAPPAFADSFAMPLGSATQASMASETVSFTASAAGTYTYLCPVMGHAQQGMYGSFVVGGS